jgi:exocyst complex protein 7
MATQTMESASVLALIEAAAPPQPENEKVKKFSDAQLRINQLRLSLNKMQTTTKESFRICDQLTKRARHLDSLTSPASDASAVLSIAAGNLQSTLTLMKDAREKFDTVSDCEPAIERLYKGVKEMEEKRKGNEKSTGQLKSRGSNPFDLDEDPFHLSSLSEQDVYAACDNMEILKDAFDYFLEHKHWRSGPSTLQSLERVHKLGVHGMCMLMTHHLMSAGQAIRVKRVVKKEGGPIVPPKNEGAEDVSYEAVVSRSFCCCTSDATCLIHNRLELV